MSRRLLAALALALVLPVLIAGIAAGGQSAGGQNSGGQNSGGQNSGGKRAAAAPAKVDASLDCPREAGLGEPFLLRLRLAGDGASFREARVRFLGREAPLALRKEAGGLAGSVLLGTDVLSDRPGARTAEVLLLLASGRTVTLKAPVRIAPVERPVESLALDPAMVNPPASELARIAAERAKAREVLAEATPRRLWSLPLARPVPGEVSSIYGLGRVLNGQPRAPHRGLDLEADKGQPVTAAAEGVVALTGAYYYAGNCVYLDHGQGLHTMYFHLSAIRVRPGERVARGQVLGLAGDTGRSTRSHLHFGVSALGRLVDPEPLFLYDALP